MDSGTKTLVRVACTVVIAAGGYYLWTQYQAHAERSERIATYKAARDELFKLAGASEGDDALVRGFCSRTRDRLTSDLAGNFVAENAVRNCRAFGFL